MSFFTIPVPEEVIPFNLQVDLNGVIYTLSFTWFPRDAYWRMTILKSGVVLLSHLKLVNTQDLLAQYTGVEDLPEGIFIVFDHDGLDSDPNATGFGDRVLLMYENAA